MLEPKHTIDHVLHFFNPQTSIIELPPIAPKGITCVGINLRNNSIEWHKAAQQLTTHQETEYSKRYKHQLDATRHLVGHALVRAMVARNANFPVAMTNFAPNKWGKPALPKSGIEFSITHSGNVVWVALCKDASVGVDSEHLSAINDPYFLTAYLHPSERTALLSQSKDAAAVSTLRCWVRKEAITKATGEGLSRPLDSFSVKMDDCSTNWINETNTLPTAEWTSADLPTIEDCLTSVAAMASELSVTSYVTDSWNIFANSSTRKLLR